MCSFIAVLPRCTPRATTCKLPHKTNSTTALNLQNCHTTPTTLHHHTTPTAQAAFFLINNKIQSPFYPEY